MLNEMTLLNDLMYFIFNCQKLGKHPNILQQVMVKQNVSYPIHGILLSNKKEQTIGT